MTSQEAKSNDSRVIQIIRPPEEPGGTIPLEVWDCSNGWNSSGFNSVADFTAAIIGYISARFDMAVEMVRSLLVKLPSEIGAPNNYKMVISIHHALQDNSCVSIIVRDLLTAYHVFAAGADEPVELPHLPLEYADYAVWQLQQLEIGRYKQDLEYWMKQLSDIPTSLSLPFDRQWPETSSGHDGTRLNISLPGKLVAALADLCAQHHSTLSVGIMAAFQLTLSRLAGNI